MHIKRNRLLLKPEKTLRIHIFSLVLYPSSGLSCNCVASPLTFELVAPLPMLGIVTRRVRESTVLMAPTTKKGSMNPPAS